MNRENRLRKLRHEMKAKGLEAVFVQSPENRYYLSGFRGSSGALLITETDALLYTDFRYLDQAAEEAPLFEVVNHQQNLMTMICTRLQDETLRHVGIELDKLPTAQYLAFNRLAPTLELSNVEPILDRIRMYKDAEEIAYLRQGIAMCDQAFAHILSYIKPGITEKEIGLELEFFMRKLGAEGIKANHVIASGERSSLPHGQATDRVIRVGDFVKMDIGARVMGYYSDFTRTVVVGQPSAKQLEIYQIVKEAQEAALAAIGPGKVCSEVDEVARSIIRAAGYGDCFGHSLGHSIGLAVHEKPTMRHNDQTVLEPGMVITVEPGIYIKGFGGVRIEDLVVITADGYDNLTTATKELQVIPV
ncbi:aminopeptidase P family protein [Brevibacillus sp. SYP-B805]|uniref:M24 family metallopeptidase n=1 Tax=Brevibacillus sp. SYP-B805 TaxID=1578199 RepID=UPI0013ECB8D7|nr:Xaa-Pro peptidase family protein [Brevibacillus sp. SYP-B805]NGQ97135.1 aminopeptidase P family protein [Brevibacillus sp. SYP-B805]